MSHHFEKQHDGSKVCRNCGDERDVNADRDCPRPSAQGNLASSRLFHCVIPIAYIRISVFYFAFDVFYFAFDVFYLMELIYGYHFISWYKVVNQRARKLPKLIVRLLSSLHVF